MKTQRKAVMEWLKSGKSITAHEAYMLCGTMRLSAIIHYLKNEKGMNIASQRYYTDQTNYSSYWLEADPYKKDAIKDFLNRGNHITEEVADQMFDCDDLNIVISELRKEGMVIVSKQVKPLCGKEFTKWFVK